jgi:hypothetical protein
MATSKQPKQPAFPHPPLETGVAQYPTPLVPNYNDKKGGWGINEQGHIILVEKISIEKGNFTPLPLDGSITYTGRDANKWPSTLYLVAERPTPDGEFCYRFWANDRSLASQNLWNYGVTYQDENPDYPIFSRTYIVPRSQYVPVALGEVDPVFGGTAIITKQGMAELPEDNPLASRYVQVQRVYETIPGPVVGGYQFDEFIEDNLTISKQIVAAGTAPITESDIHASSGDPYLLSFKDEPIDSTKSQRIIVTTPSLPPTRTEYTTGTYTSPLLVFNLVTESTNLSCDYANADTRIKITPITRASQSGPTIFKNIISYSYGPPAPSDTSLFRPVLKDVAYTGYVINYNIGAALCNRIQSSYTYYYYINGNVLTQTTNQVPVKYCDFLGEPEPIAYESWDIAATDISADGYMDLIGTYQKISWESHYWKAGIWQNKEVQVLLF